MEFILNKMALEYLINNNKYKVRTQNYIKFIEVSLDCIYKLFTERKFCPFISQRLVDDTRFPEIWEYHSTNCDKNNYVNPKLTLQYTNDKFNIIDGQHSLHAICDRSEKDFSKIHKNNIKFDILIYINMSNDDAKRVYININKSVPVAKLELSSSEEKKLIEETWNLIKEYYPIKYFSGNINCRPPKLNRFRFMDEFNNNIWEAMVNRGFITAHDLFDQIKLFNEKIEKNFDDIAIKEKDASTQFEKKVLFLSELYGIKIKSGTLKRYENKIIDYGASGKYCYLGLIKNCQWLNKLFVV